MSAEETPQTQQVRSERHEPDFYARIPKMASLELTPYEVALYLNYKMTAADDGICFKSDETLAAETHMGITKVKECRNSLIEKGYIRKETNNREDGNSITITIVWLWDENHQRFSEGSRHESTPSSPGVYPVAATSLQSKSLVSKSPEEESTKEIQTGFPTPPVNRDIQRPSGKNETIEGANGPIKKEYGELALKIMAASGAKSLTDTQEADLERDIGWIDPETLQAHEDVSPRFKYQMDDMFHKFAEWAIAKQKEYVPNGTPSRSKIIAHLRGYTRKDGWLYYLKEYASTYKPPVNRRSLEDSLMPRFNIAEELMRGRDDATQEGNTV